MSDDREDDETTVEYIARRINSRLNGRDDAASWNVLDYRALLLHAARDALDALKRPTDEMINKGAGELATEWTSDESPFAAARNVWLSMIDTALQEPPT